MPDLESWSEWMRLALGVALVVVAALAIWIVVLALRMVSRRPGGPTDTERAGGRLTGERRSTLNAYPDRDREETS